MFAMATYSAFALASLLVVAASGADQKGKAFCFSFAGSSNNRTFGAEFALYGDAEMLGPAVRITQPVKASSGRVAYRKPLRFFGINPGFSSSFSFALSPGDGGRLAFFLSPSGVPPEPVNGDWSRVSTSLLAVSFQTAKADKTSNLTRTLIEIDEESSNLSGHNLALDLDTGEKLNSWIDYDGESKRIEVRLSQEKDTKLINSSISHSIDLSYLLRQETAWAVGLSSRTRHSFRGCSIFSWNFTPKHGAPFPLHSEPLDPNSSVAARPSESAQVHPAKSHLWGTAIAVSFAAACGAMLASFATFAWSVLRPRRPVALAEHPAQTVGDKILENGQQ